jgi:hypothetical protein
VVKRFPSEPLQSCLGYYLQELQEYKRDCGDSTQHCGDSTQSHGGSTEKYGDSPRLLVKHLKVWRFYTSVVKILHKLCRVYMMIDKSLISVYGGTRSFTNNLPYC